MFRTLHPFSKLNGAGIKARTKIFQLQINQMVTFTYLFLQSIRAVSVEKIFYLKWISHVMNADI